MSIEPNDIIADANDTGVSSEGTRNTVIEGTIDPNSDVDLYRFQANAGEGVIIDIDADEFSSGLDPILRLFDGSGNELAVSDDNPAPGEDSSLDSYLTFIPDISGDYYVGVSSFSNFNYDAVNGGSNDDSASSSGDYQLNLSLVEVQPDDDPDNTISEAGDSGVSSGGQNTVVIQESIDPQGDVDVFKFQLNEGDRVTLNINAQQIDSGLDPILRLFDEFGNELAVNDDNEAPGENFSLDSYIDFTAATTGEYYVGVSAFANFDYDAVNGRTNFDVDNSFSTGDYELVINAFNNVEGTDRRDVLIGTQRNDSIQGKNGNDILTGRGGNDNLLGGADNDILTGNDGNDTLIGGDGSDRLLGNNGDDVLQGNSGSNSYYGGQGADIFVISSDSGVDDVIYDFRDGTDKILIQGASFFDATIESADFGFSTSISVFDNPVATLIGVDPNNISEDDFA
ncbi:DVUA0089 family protein [Waterburya agarophytonicola K14]|uniref:DVUA0089 family protein n=1 Tax=Waterburya agarophytonicola KI4 TaxID=2874699 RepID=A0A964BPQ3_9CYAN|nr:DVUA0089 family protein [Waterburya agarophytonicola]MCC0177135.1 DVUA0089 family protein [Waterburya agarophytonicola KI4]